MPPDVMTRIFINQPAGEDAQLHHGGVNLLQIHSAEPVQLIFFDPRGAVLVEVTVSGEASAVPLGPLLCPPEFRYRSGVVEWRGYSLRIVSAEGAETWYAQQTLDAVLPWKFREPSRRSSVSRLIGGRPSWQRLQMEAAFSPPIGLRLSGHALIGDWAATRLVISNPASAAPSSEWSFRVLVRDGAGDILTRSEAIASSLLSEPIFHDINASAFSEGRYLISLEIEQDGRTYFDGPEIVLHKKSRSDLCCVNPYARRFLPLKDGAPTFSVAVSDINEALAEAHGPELDSLTRMREWPQTRRVITKVISVDSPAALFLESGAAGCGFSLDEEEPKIILPDVRSCVAILQPGEYALRFCSLFSLKNEPSLVKSLTVVPLRTGVGYPIVEGGIPIVGINDWAEYFGANTVPLISQLERIISSQKNLGFGEIAWAVARSWVEYESALPQTSRWPVVPLEDAVTRDPRAYNYVGRTTLTQAACPLRRALHAASEAGVTFTAWMALNTHYYAEAIGGICCSRWFQENPRFHQWRKGAEKSFPGEVSFYFEGVREERIAILDEVAGLGVDRFLLDATRQPRVVLYHPEMVAEYKALTGVDPSRIDATHGQSYEDWILWRSGFFTQFLRDLRTRLSKHYPERKFSLSMRIPQCDFALNLASGFDAKTWLREGLVDRLYLNPLEIYDGGLREVAPYVDLGRETGVEIYGGIGQTWSWGEGLGATAALLRAASLIDAGVDGIDFFESELLSRHHPLHDLIPLMRDRHAIRDLLEDSNLPACYPFDLESVMLGYDNHSRWTGQGWRREGFSENCL